MRSPWGERGAVTAELAIGLLGLTAVLAGLLSLVVVVLAQVQVHDAAAAAARLAARGEPPARVREVASSVVGHPAAVEVAAGGGTTSVVVRRQVELLLPGRPQVEVVGRAEAVTEMLADVGPAP
ncbi:TadE family type IV pilus minor pilin [Angustibacter speluncae]